MDRFADVILTPIALFSGRPLAVILALSILAAAIGLWIVLLLPAERRFVGKLKRIAGAIRTARLAGGSQEKQFAEADRIFENSDLVAPWLRYRSSVEFEDGAAESYADPAAFFSVGYLPGHGYVKWSGTLGGVFLTVGLFFTFVGLSAALLQMGGDGHGSLNPAQLKIAVEGILAVSSVKFITSIAGILAYIFWSVVARQQSSTQVHAEEHLLAEIRALSIYVAPEMLLRRQLRVAERQSAQFANMAEMLGHRVDAALGGSLEALPQAIAQSVSSSVTAAFSPIREEISAVNSRIGEANASVAESAGAAFGNLWREGIGQNLQAFGAQLATALAALDQLPGKFRDAEAGFGGEIGRSAGELNASAQRMSSALAEGQASLAATLAAFEEKVGSIPARLAAATEQSSQDIGASLRRTLDGAASAATEASRNGGEIISARMAEISAALTAAAATLTQAGQASHAHMAEGAKMLSESSEASAARLSSTVGSFGLAVNRLASRLDEVERGLDAQNRRLANAGEIVSGASDSLAKAAGAMESAAAPLTTATLSFQGAMDRFSEAAGQIHQISASGDSIGAHIAAFGTQMSDSLAAFDALPEKIKATESGFGGEIGRSASQLTDAASRMSAAFERGQAALAQTMAGFQAKIEAIPSSIAAASEKSSQEIGAKVRQALDDATSLANEASRSGADIMASRVGEITRALATAAIKLQAASEASGEQLQASHQNLASGVAGGAKIIAETAENSATKLSQTVDSFAAAVLCLSSKLGEVMDGLDAQNARLEKAGVVVSGASNTLAMAAGSVAKAATPLTTASNSFQGAMEIFSGAADQIVKISESGQSVADRIEGAAAAAHQSLGSHVESFRDVERSVTQTLTGLVRGVQDLGQEISACIATYDNEIAKSIGSLEAALLDVGDIVDDRASKRVAAEAS
ncbi:hypothetical protein [Rhodoblastus sp.]|uniref:hypothetical protein n=1 Tax=Rhodoblastus sp. TaxID=1962975 RepID=UPI003F9D5D43